MTDTMVPSETPETKINPLEVARLLRAFIECNRETQEAVLEMTAIIADESSTIDERMLAFDALMEALFPGTAADILESYRSLIKSGDAVKVAEELKTEERTFSERVKSLLASKGITQAELADKAGIGQPAVSNIINRRCRPQRRTVERFAVALGVAPEELWPQNDLDD